MKLSFLLLFIATLQAMATGHAQTVSLDLNMENTSMRNVFREIERKTDLSFIFSDDVSSLNDKVSVNVHNEKVIDILDDLFKDTDLGYRILNEKLIVIATKETLQNKVITGIVTDAKGEPLIGVNISIKGTSTGVITDAGGKYTLEQVPDQSILVFSYIGYISQEIKVGNQPTVNVRLEEDMQNLNEVVVVGYGTQRKETLTGAVASINASQITTTKSLNLVNDIQGKLPGLLYRPNNGEPGDFNMSLSIRGYGSPVLVIDGVVRNRGGAATELAQINSEDIESVSILKDASAAIYGMNAANGVIIVTTKKGTNDKVRFSYSGMFGSKAPVGLPELMNVVDTYNFFNEMARNEIASPRYSQDLINKYKEGVFPYVNNDWIDLYFHKWTPITQSHNLSARGGTDKVNFFTGIGYDDDKGIISTDVQWYRRFTLTSNVSAQLRDDLKMNVMLSGRFDQRQADYFDFYYTYNRLLITDRGLGPYTETGHISSLLPNATNPAAIANKDVAGYRMWNNTTIRSQMDLTYSPTFLRGLDINLLGSFDTRTENYSRTVKAYDSYDYFTDKFVATLLSNTYQNTMNLSNRGYFKLQGDYKFASKGHNLNIMAAIEASQERYDYLDGQRTYEGIFTSDILDLGSAANPTNAGNREFRRYAAMIGRVNYDYQGKYLIEGMLRRDGSYRYAPGKRWTWFPSVSVGWRVSEEAFFKNHVAFINNLKLRASYGESGKDAGSAYQYIAAYGTDSSNYNYVFTDGQYIVGYHAPGVVNDKLSWVTAKFYNAAVDADFLKSKISTTIEYFQRFNTGLLAPRNTTVPNTFGASFPDENINSDMNTGIDFQIYYRDKIGAVRYSAGANITYARTKRLHVERGKFTSAWDKWRNGNENRYTGRSLLYDMVGQYTSFDQFKTAPLYGGNQGNTRMQPGSANILDANGDGRINDQDQLFIGWGWGEQGYISGGADWAPSRYIPPLEYGFPFEVGYKSFDFNMLWTGSSLFSVNLPKNEAWGYGRYLTLHARFVDRWHVEPIGTDANGNAVYPDLLDPATVWTPGKYAPLRVSDTGTMDNVTTERWRPDATYIRLKSIELGYTIPKSAVKKIGLNSARFYVNGFNVLTFAGSKVVRDYDPEKHEGDWNVGTNNPSMKAVNFGINLTF